MEREMEIEIIERLYIDHKLMCFKYWDKYLTTPEGIDEYGCDREYYRDTYYRHSYTCDGLRLAMGVLGLDPEDYEETVSDQYAAR